MHESVKSATIKSPSCAFERRFKSAREVKRPSERVGRLLLVKTETRSYYEAAVERAVRAHR